MPEHLPDPIIFAQVERLPADPLAVGPGRFATKPLDGSKTPDPFAHILLPEDGEAPGSGDS